MGAGEVILQDYKYIYFASDRMCTGICLGDVLFITVCLLLDTMIQLAMYKS